MITYITAFIFYTMAMVGVLLIGFIIYKKTFAITKNEKKGMMKVLDTLSIGPKKMLLVVKIKNEKYLIATDSDRTTFLAKLEEESVTIEQTQKQPKPQGELSSEIQYKEKQEARLDKIQKQFRELYSSNDDEDSNEQKPNRKEMIRQLLKDLNDSSANIEGKY